jgi:tRNA pseudouridine38-40 synthase
MARYFIEVAYKGTAYSGFQIQENANTIQSEVEKALFTLHRHPFQLTGSSRTDAGVHALQNYFHFDYQHPIHPQAVYKLNAILPPDIVVRSIHLMSNEAHARFDAISREYTYKIHSFKNPFLANASLYYPYKLDIDLLQAGAAYVLTQQNFFAFSKTNTQVKNFQCTISKSQWLVKEEGLSYNIEGNRFLRGMVRMLTATLLKLGRGKISLQEFEAFFHSAARSSFSLSAHGLYLIRVVYPSAFFSSFTTL